MNIQVQKWGNSLAIRLPKAFANQTQIGEGTLVEVKQEDESIIIRPVVKGKYSLKKMLAEVNAKNLHKENKVTEVLGKEVW